MLFLFDWENANFIFPALQTAFGFPLGELVISTLEQKMVPVSPYRPFAFVAGSHVAGMLRVLFITDKL